MNLIDKVFVTDDVADLLKAAGIPIIKVQSSNEVRIFETILTLYEMYGVWVEVGYGFHPAGFYWLITDTKNKKTYLSETDAFQPSFYSPSEAYLAVIKYTVNKIIK